MEKYEEMEMILQNNIKLNNETIVKKAIDFVVEVLREQGRSFRGDYATESWDYKFHPDIEELYIKWRKKPSENNIDTVDSDEKVLLKKYKVDKKGITSYVGEVHLQEVINNMCKSFKENKSENLIDKVNKFITENHRGKFPTNEWVQDFNPDIESINIKWKKKQYGGDYELDATKICKERTLNVESNIHNYKHNDFYTEGMRGGFEIQKAPKSIEDLLMDLKFLDDKPFHVNSQAIYEEFMDAGLDVKMSRCFTRSFMKYFYENDSWRVRMNDVWAEWEYYLSNEDDIEKVKIALHKMGLERDE